MTVMFATSSSDGEDIIHPMGYLRLQSPPLVAMAHRLPSYCQGNDTEGEDCQANYTETEDCHGHDTEEEEEEPPPLLCPDLEDRIDAATMMLACSSSRADTRRAFLNHMVAYPERVGSILATLRCIQRHRIALPDPLRSFAAAYNRDAGSGTMAELVRDTEDVAATCVDDFLSVNRHQLSGNVGSSFESQLRSSVEEGLTTFYVDFYLFMKDLGDDAVACMRDMSLPDAIQCCQEFARDHVREMLQLR